MRADVRDPPEPAPAKAGERLPKELAARGIDTMQQANRYLAEHYRAAFNEEFTVPGSAFVPFVGPALMDVLCEHHERTVARDDCLSSQGKRLQIPAQAHRCHFIEARVRMHRYPDGRMAVFHGPRRLADYEPDGSLVGEPPHAGMNRSAPDRVDGNAAELEVGIGEVRSGQLRDLDPRQAKARVQRVPSGVRPEPNLDRMLPSPAGGAAAVETSSAVDHEACAM